MIIGGISGCATYPDNKSDKVNTAPGDSIIKQKNPSQNYYRRPASDSLTREGIALYKKGDLDGAIRIFEQAIGINPYEGLSYYYLAESWIGKNNFKLASQYNKLAEIHLRTTRIWLERIAVQKKKIEKGLKSN